MAVRSIERVFTSLHTITQHLAGIGTNEPSRHTCLQKCTISRLVLAFIAKLAVRRLPSGCDIAFRSGLSTLAVTADKLFPQKSIAIAHPSLQQRWNNCEQIQKSLKYENYLCLVNGAEPMLPLTDMILTE